jgi:hypothetical protein
MIVVEGLLPVDHLYGERRYREDTMRAGEGSFIPHGVPQGGEVEAGSRTINALGGHRANRVENSPKPVE